MEMVKNAVSWIEIPATDFARAKKFYSAIFDYEMPEMQMGPILMGFLLSDQETGVGGAIVHGEGCVPNADGARVYLNGGADLTVVLNRIESAGGKIAVPKTEIAPDMGNFAMFIDSEGNMIGLHSMG